MTIDKIYQIFLSCGRISTDSRHIQGGELFIALKGANYNGNRYAAQALEQGARYAIVDDPETAIDDRFLCVKDTQETLQDLAHHHRNQLNIPVFGLTGSNGKTTTKELLLAVLSKKFRVSATSGNYNNHIGVPLTILSADKDAELLLIEMGTNQPGDIALLCAITEPDFGLITNIGAAHLELLKDLEGVLAEKRSLFDAVLKKKGIYFLNTGDPYLRRLLSSSDKIIRYTKTQGPFGTLRYVPENQKGDSVYELEQREKSYSLTTHLTGQYNQENIAAVLTVGSFFGIPVEDVVPALASYVPHNMRSEIRRTDRNTLILDAYNANPSSMKTSIEAFLSKWGASNKILILGDMLELGTSGPAYHQDIIDLLVAQSIQNVFLVGKIFTACQTNDYAVFEEVSTLKNSGQLKEIEHHVIFIKGSRGVQLETLISEL